MNDQSVPSDPTTSKRQLDSWTSEPTCGLSLTERCRSRKKRSHESLEPCARSSHPNIYHETLTCATLKTNNRFYTPVLLSSHQNVESCINCSSSSGILTNALEHGLTSPCTPEHRQIVNRPACTFLRNFTKQCAFTNRCLTALPYPLRLTVTRWIQQRNSSSRLELS